MDITEFVERFIEVYDDAENIALTPNSYYKELEEYSSLTALSIIAFIDEHFDVEITGKDIRETDTIQDLYDRIFEKVNG